MSLTKDKIREVCVANGFKLKPQSDGTMDLNPYVYDVVYECLNHQYPILAQTKALTEQILDSHNKLLEEQKRLRSLIEALQYIQ